MKRAVLYLRVSTIDQTTANQEREPDCLGPRARRPRGGPLPRGDSNFGSSPARTFSGVLSPRLGCPRVTSACPDHDRCNVILRGRSCVRQIAILTIQLIGPIAARSADPAVVEPMNDQRGAIRERDTSRCFVNPEIHVLFDARRSNAAGRIYDDYFFCRTV
jgi:hypothetical protein